MQADPGRNPAPSTVAERLALRLDEVARALGVSRRAIERERSVGRFPKPDLTIGRMPLWMPETIREWIRGSLPMIRPRDAWTFNRLVTGLDVNGELDDLPERVRPMADRLAGVIVDEALTGQARREALAAARWTLWETMMAARPDRDELAALMNDVDPDKPPPEADEGDEAAADGWEPIRLGALPPAEPFPLDVLPEPARRLAEVAAESIACPVDFPAVAILAVASGIIGRSASLLIKAGYFASASLYLALVGSPSTGKSPALRAALAPLWFIANELYDQWRCAMDAWEQAKPDEREEPPELERVVSTDPTTEALAPILAKNPRGLTVAPDEMTKWVMSMDQYKGGKGGDRPFYLSAWAGEPVYIDRAKHMREPIAVPQPFLTVMGGMTLDMLSTLAEGRGREDGFVARLLFCYPRADARTPLFGGRHSGCCSRRLEATGFGLVGTQAARQGRQAGSSRRQPDSQGPSSVGGVVSGPLCRARGRGVPREHGRPVGETGSLHAPIGVDSAPVAPGRRHDAAPRRYTA